MSEQVYSKILLNPIYCVACGFGAGLVPFAPGTFGTIIAIPFYILLRQFPFYFYLMFLVAATLLGIWLCDVTAKAFKQHDDSRIVWDEMVGYWLTMIVAPHTLTAIIAGFLLFRLFDIWKPWPIDWLDQHCKGGFGIMLDDLMAALYAAFFLMLLHCLMQHG